MSAFLVLSQETTPVLPILLLAVAVPVIGGTAQGLAAAALTLPLVDRHGGWLFQRRVAADAPAPARRLHLLAGACLGIVNAVLVFAGLLVLSGTDLWWSISRLHGWAPPLIVQGFAATVLGAGFPLVRRFPRSEVGLDRERRQPLSSAAFRLVPPYLGALVTVAAVAVVAVAVVE